MNFLVGFFIKGFVFHELRPNMRAAATAVTAYAFCIGVSMFGAYFLVGVHMAFFAFTTIAVAYLAPAFFHFIWLYYQFNMAWTYTDEDEEAELAQIAAQSPENRKVATLRRNESPED